MQNVPLTSISGVLLSGLSTPDSSCGNSREDTLTPTNIEVFLNSANLGFGQAIVTTGPSGSGDQQLSDNQQPITTVVRPIRSANII